MTDDWPPMSEYRTGGVSRNTERIADGRMEGSDAARSSEVSFSCKDLLVANEDGGCKDSQRFIATVPASRTTALKSAPT
jgi:hypothetical protein